MSKILTKFTKMVRQMILSVPVRWKIVGIGILPVIILGVSLNYWITTGLSDWLSYILTDVRVEAAMRAGSRSVMFVTVIAAVLSIGLVVNVKIQSARIPCPEGGWRHVDATGRRQRLVWRMIAMLWVLNGLDLICTLLANHEGRFHELNPLGGLLMGSSVALAVYKIGAVALGSAVLLAYRRYRGAEVAVWWLCLVYAVLSFRWATQASFLV